MSRLFTHLRRLGQVILLAQFLHIHSHMHPIHPPLHKRLHEVEGKNVIPTSWILKTDAEIAEKKWDCDRPWPELTLFAAIRAYANNREDPEGFYQAEYFLVNTVLKFWPLHVSKTKIIFSYDKEMQQYASIQNLHDTLKDMCSPQMEDGTFEFVPIPEFPYYDRGYDRQQYNMFWSTNYTNATYIGFVDTDTAFITYVDREDLFEDGKPVINGQSGEMDWIRGRWAKGTYEFLHLLQPMTCMSYFPVIIKRDHIIEMREYISRIHGKPFDEVFYNLTQTPYSQFGVFCSYIWHFHQDEYTWYVHTKSPHWDGENPAPFEGQDGNMSIFSPEMYRPKPRVATHGKYRYCAPERCPTEAVKNSPAYPIDGIKYAGNLDNFIKAGTCRSPPFPEPEKMDSKCGVYQNRSYFEMHNFEFNDYSKNYYQDALDYEAKLRYQRIKYCGSVERKLQS